MLKGIAASEGIGIGKIFAVTQQKITYEQKPVIGVHKEIDRLHGAIDTFVEKTEALAAKMEKAVNEKDLSEAAFGRALMCPIVRSSMYAQDMYYI